MRIQFKKYFSLLMAMAIIISSMGMPIAYSEGEITDGNIVEVIAETASEVTPLAVEPLTIAEAKAVTDGTMDVTTKGIITYKNGKNVYIQDTTGAICLFLTANATSAINVGDEVIATGKRETYNGLVELSGIVESTIQVLSSGNAIPNSGVFTLAEITSTPTGKTAGYDHMCEILDLNNVMVSSTGALWQNDMKVTVYPIISATKFPSIAVGDTVNATVRISAFKGAVQVEVISMSETVPEIPMKVTASALSGNLNSGTLINLMCNNSNASVYYTVDGSDPTSLSTNYSGSIKVEGSLGSTVTFKAIAIAEGRADSEIAILNYKMLLPIGPMSIKDVLALPTNTPNVEVIGTLSYFAAQSNPVIQTVIDGNIYSLYIFGKVPTGAKLGDLIKFKGTYTIFNGLPEMTSILSSEIVSPGTPIPPQENTIDFIKKNGLSMIGRIVRIKDATLGTYSASSNTPVTDSTGTMNIFKATPFPTLVTSGDVVDIYAMISNYKGTIQLNIGTKEDNGFNVYDVVNDIKAPLITLKDLYLDAIPGSDYVIAVNVADNKGVQAVNCTYTIGDKTVADQEMVYSPSTMDYRMTIPGIQIPFTQSEIAFTVNATDVSGLVTTTASKAITIDKNPKIIEVQPGRNSATGDDKSPIIAVRLQNGGLSPQVKLTLTKDGATLIEAADMIYDETTQLYKYATNQLAEGNYYASVLVTREDNAQVFTIWTFTVGKPQFTAFFGQLHGHTAEYSDGSGTLANGLDYLSALPASENVNFVAFTDHSNYFDTTKAPNAPEALNNKTLMTPDSLVKWNRYVSTMNNYNDSQAGRKIALPGFEMTWSGGPGHINTFNSDGLVSRNNTTLNNKSSDAGLKAYYNTLIQNPDPLANLSQFNHPGTTFGTFADFAYWSPSYDNKMVAVEVGNGEGAIGSGGYFPSYTEYTKALDKGWHVAPTNNQDNHKGLWGNANTARTVIITDDFSSKGLLKGMKDMSVYATEDKNLNIRYSLNDQMMGSIISEVPLDPLRFELHINDPDADDVISKVEIITNGGRVAEAMSFTSNVVDWTFQLPSVQGYYYVRVTQADKSIAVTAPIWIGQAPLVGISSFGTTTKMPVTGEALSFSTTLFNNEAAPVILKSIQYATGGEVLKVDAPNTAIAPMSSNTNTLTYTPMAPGKQTITVTAIIEVNGTEKQFTKDVTINVRDSSKLVYVGIDASHFNEYVNGNYKDSMGNFADLAVNYDVRVVELKTSEELINATQNPKFAMLILTPPTRRAGDYFLNGYMNYTDSEIAALKAFAELGKTIVITGWGDYYESYTAYSNGTPYQLPPSDHMSTQQNRVLEAIGSKIRISDDEIKDKVTNGGQEQRLYLKDYNMSHPFLKNVVPSEQVYSNYAGATLYTVGADKLPTNVLPASVSPMVSSFTTSYSSDDDKDGTTGTSGVVVPKYDNRYLVAASESVSYANGKTATIIAAGAVFMSNFEIQVALDTYSTPAYSNYTILENIVEFINPVVITKIADVQAAPSGQIFTIRGIVTSNASGYDKDTAFFDCIYIQDETGGINAFPVAGNIRAGQTVEIKGTTSAYNGERQIAVEKIKIIDATVKPLPQPIELTTAQAGNASHLGSLVKISGIVVGINYANGAVESILVKDDSEGVARVFIDGYITKDKTIANLELYANISAIGLSSIDTVGARIRIRDRSDVVCTPPTAYVVVDEVNHVATATVITRDVINQNGKVVGVIKDDLAMKLISKLEMAEASGMESVLEIRVETSASARLVEAQISRTVLETLNAKTNADIEVKTALGSLQYDIEVLKKIQNTTKGSSISLSIGIFDEKAISKTMLKTVGGNQIYDFTILSGGKTLSAFGNGQVKISIPKEFTSTETPQSIYVYYMDDRGKLQKVLGTYNPEQQAIEFSLSLF